MEDKDRLQRLWFVDEKDAETLQAAELGRGSTEVHPHWSPASLARLKVRFYSGVNLNSYANQKVHVIVKAEIVASCGN